MILNLGSLSFNMEVEEGGGTPAWGTEMGQGEGYKFAFENMEPFLTSMVYNSISDINEVTCPLGKGGAQAKDYEFVLASVYKKIYVNDIKVDNSEFLLLIVKKMIGDYHVGRRTLKYNPRIRYHNRDINKDCYKKIANTLGLSENSAWFINEINTKNQDELHFVAYIVNKFGIQTYTSNQEKKRDMMSQISTGLVHEENYVRKNSHQTIYFGSPGTGKSYKIQNNMLHNVSEDLIFRTTFHPDSDYASFVGCYKPVCHKKNSIVIKNEYYKLVDILKEKISQNPSNLTNIFVSFGYDYMESILDLENSGNHTIKDLVTEAYQNSTYDTIIRAGMQLKKERPSEETTTISYEFIPQAFTDAYICAWQNQNELVYLVIEEINRGNCAQIFGDLFQLLDRNDDGISEYTIKADTDLKNYLVDKLGNDHLGIKDGKLCLPGNLRILATMNTSDQSLFPMDSAFKRRWAWEYVPIDSSNTKSQFQITIGDKTYKWSSFLDKANERIHKLSDSEDKQIGNFFIKNNIDVEEFKSKVMFYLWSEVCKEYEKSGSFFKDKNDNDSEFTFNSLFPTNDDTNKRLQGFMAYLDVEEV